jgi:GNAT superfamily N-acetyltransferase
MASPGLIDHPAPSAPPSPASVASAGKSVRLRDGSRVTLRPATPGDEAALREFLAGMCPEARRLRFFSGAANTDMAAHWAVAMGADRYGLIATDAAGAIVAHASYVQLEVPRGEPARAEVAVEVADALHGCGLGTILIERLARVAERRGIVTFTAEVLPENRAMLDVFRDGFDARLTFREGLDSVQFPAANWRLARERFA